MQRLAALREQVKAMEAEAAGLKNSLLQSAQGNRLQVGPQGGPYGQPQFIKGRATVDIAGLREEAPELVAKHERIGQDTASFNLYRFGG